MWLNFDDINNETTYDVEELRDCYAMSGNDLSAITDLTCATLLIMKTGSDCKYVMQMYFLPEELLKRRVQEEKIPYDKWHECGLLRLCTGNKVNYSDVTAWYV